MWLNKSKIYIFCKHFRQSMFINCWHGYLLFFTNPGAEPPPVGWVGFEPLVLPERFPRGVRGSGSAPGFSPERSEGENTQLTRRLRRVAVDAPRYNQSSLLFIFL